MVFNDPFPYSGNGSRIFFGCVFSLSPLIALEVQRGSRYKLSDIFSINETLHFWSLLRDGPKQIQCLDSPAPLSFRILFGSIGKWCKCARVYSPFNCPLRFRCAIIFLGEFTTQHKVLPPKKQSDSTRLPNNFQFHPNLKIALDISQVSGQVSRNLQTCNQTSSQAKLFHEAWMAAWVRLLR